MTMTEGEISGAMGQLGISRAEAETVQHIGDGIYCTFDGWHVWARTLEGERVAFDPDVMEALVKYDRQAREPRP